METETTNRGGLVIGVIVVIFIGIVAYFSFGRDGNPSNESMMKDDAMMVDDGVSQDADAMMKDEDSTMQVDEDAMMQKAGSYEAYSPEKVSAKAEAENVVLFFRASWCPTCRALDADIQAHLDEIPSDLTILDVDYDNSASLKKKYGVTYQHTFVEVDKDGNQIKKWFGSPTLAALVSEI